MKSSLLILAALLMLVSAKPAMALSVDHDSNYADAGGGSRFSDPDDALGGDDGNSNPLGTMQFGSSNGSSGGFSFGISGSNDGENTAPGYAMQGCHAASCYR